MQLPVRQTRVLRWQDFMEFTLPDSVPLRSRSGFDFSRNAARLACLAAMQLGLMACAEQSEPDVAEIICEDGAIGTFRTIELTENSVELWQKLEAREVVLTFDDGPHRSRTPEVLDVLAEQCVKATFFLRGDQAAAHPKLVRRIAVAGHVVGAHGLVDEGCVVIVDALGEAREEPGDQLAVVGHVPGRGEDLCGRGPVPAPGARPCIAW